MAFLCHARWFIGSLLIVTAFLKALAGAEAGRFLDSYNLSIAVILVELALAASCFSGFAPRATRAALGAFFSCVLLVALYSAVAGDESCGCFGPVKVHPWWTAMLDAAVLGIVFFWNPRRENEGCESAQIRTARCWAVFLTIYAVVALPIVGGLLALRPTEQFGGAVPDDTGGIVILDPETWRGETLPIAVEMDIGARLTSGEWTLLLYHHDCPKCQAAVPRYVELAEQFQQEGSNSRVALVETPPYAAEKIAISLPRTCVAGRLNDRREWFVQTPVEISVKDGRVVGVRQEL